VWTEMLAARQILSENFTKSPWLRRHPMESCLFYQLMVNSEDPIERVLGRLDEAGADALDLNLACDSRTARSCLAGSALFADFNALSLVLHRVRRHWPHVLTVKIRLGHEGPDWQPRFVERLKLLEGAGVDAVILHVRFVEERFKRRARHELFPWAASLTGLPLIANGDLTDPDSIRQRDQDFRSVRAIMLGRIAVARPWIFSTWDRPANVDLAAIWEKMYYYITEDFPANLAFRRLKMFSKYFAANFKFGHQFITDLARASSLQDMRERAHAFFARAPEITVKPTVFGL
jgi:tRNA-dihydrouridine synthase B